MRFSFILMLSAVLFAAGCVSHVRFAPHAPYPTERMVDSTLLVLLPSDIDERFEKATYGTSIDPMYFRAYYGEALRHEIDARFRSSFGELAMATKLEHDIALDLPLEPPSTTDKKELEKWQERYEFAQDRAEFLPSAVTEQVGYLLEFENVRFTLANKTPVYVADVRFVNRETGKELFGSTMRARAVGPRVGERNAKHHQEQVLREAMLATCTELLRNLTSEMMRAIAEDIESPQTGGKP